MVDLKSNAVKNKCMVDETEGLLTLVEFQAIKSSGYYNDAVRLVIQAGCEMQLTL